MLTATGDFTATINGRAYRLGKGEPFEGDERAKALLTARGLVAESKTEKSTSTREDDK